MLRHELFFLRVPNTQCGVQDTLLENGTQAGARWAMQGGGPCSGVGASSGFRRLQKPSLPRYVLGLPLGWHVLGKDRKHVAVAIGEALSCGA